MTPLRALIFDVDGTLAETEREGHRVAFNRAFRDFGLSWHWDINFYGTLLAIGGGKERIQHFIKTHEPPVPDSFEAGDIVKLHRLKNEHYANILSQGEISLRLGVKRLLSETRHHQISLAIATTSSLSNTLALLQQQLGSDAEQWFQVIGAGDVVPHKKPAPDIYEYVLAKLQYPPESCLVFEDSAAGVAAAHAAGLKTVMTLNSYTQSHSRDHATVVVTHLGEPDHPCEIVAGSVQNFPGWIDLDVCQQILA